MNEFWTTGGEAFVIQAEDGILKAHLLVWLGERNLEYVDGGPFLVAFLPFPEGYGMGPCEDSLNATLKRWLADHGLTYQMSPKARKELDRLYEKSKEENPGFWEEFTGDGR